MSWFIFFFVIFKILLLLIPILLAIAFLTLVERKVLAQVQRRIGPNFVGFLGFLQPIADALKLLTKETIIPRGSNTIIFIFSPLITFFISLSGWTVIPTGPSQVIADINLGILYLFTISSLSVYGIIMARLV
jgi:NADH-quinone oxidoreductase subunit H